MTTWRSALRMGEVNRVDFPGYEALYDRFDSEWKAIAMAWVNEGKA